MPLKPVELVHKEILAKPDSRLKPLAEMYENSCREMWAAPVGRDFIRYLCALAHPCKHIPYADPHEAAHAAGRAEMVAFIVMTASPDDIPELSQLTPPNHQHQTP